jgi:hypothetical protein
MPTSTRGLCGEPGCRKPLESDRFGLCGDCKTERRRLAALRRRERYNVRSAPHIEANIAIYEAWVAAGGRLEELWEMG